MNLKGWDFCQLRPYLVWETSESQSFSHSNYVCRGYLLFM